MDIIKIVQEETSRKILEAIVLPPMLLLSLLVKPFRVFLIETIPTLISNKTLCLLLYLICWLLIVCIAWIYILNKKLKDKIDFTNFEHDPDKQCWIHKTTGQRICAACKLENRLSPLDKLTAGGWKCPIHPDIIDYPHQGSSHYVNFDE